MPEKPTKSSLPSKNTPGSESEVDASLFPAKNSGEQKKDKDTEETSDVILAASFNKESSDGQSGPASSPQEKIGLVGLIKMAIKKLGWFLNGLFSDPARRRVMLDVMRGEGDETTDAASSKSDNHNSTKKEQIVTPEKRKDSSLPETKKSMDAASQAGRQTFNNAADGTKTPKEPELKPGPGLKLDNVAN